MDPKALPAVRFRLIFELTFPDANPWDPTEYQKLLHAVTNGIENAANVRCADVQLREAATFGPDNSYEDWRGGGRIDFSSFDSGAGFVGGVEYPVAAVDADDVARVWRVLDDAESVRSKRPVNLAVAVGQQLRPESNAQAVIARVFILRALQAQGTVPQEGSPTLFEKAATFPLEQRPVDEGALKDLAQFLLP